MAERDDQSPYILETYNALIPVTFSERRFQPSDTGCLGTLRRLIQRRESPIETVTVAEVMQGEDIPFKDLLDTEKMSEQLGFDKRMVSLYGTNGACEVTSFGDIFLREPVNGELHCVGNIFLEYQSVSISQDFSVVPRLMSEDLYGEPKEIGSGQRLIIENIQKITVSPILPPGIWLP
ncbi:MAG TPA: hypothetical protein VGT05_03550 [Patescibacteria group bacterium]|nr:hypothetical protein [Patescibacteria group bacterium]